MIPSQDRSRGTAVLALALLLVGCADEDDSADRLAEASFDPVVPLTVADVSCVVQAAANAVDDPNLTVAVVDRAGNVLAAWRRNPLTTEVDLNKAVAIARSAAFLSSSQGPLTSRTLEYISTFHFPPAFDDVEPRSFPTLVPQRVTTGVANTPQGPLWQIFTSNRGAPLARPGLTVPETVYAPGMEVPPATNIDGSTPGPGLGYLPGGIPLYKPGLPAELGARGMLRVVGGVGCYSADPSGSPSVRQLDTMEFAALEAATASGTLCDPFNFPGIPDEGAIFLVGVPLPYVEQSRRPPGVGPGIFDAAGYVVAPSAGDAAPFGWLIEARADPLGNLSEADVRRIVEQGIDTANGTRAAIRLPLGSTTRMIFAVCNLDGLVLGVFRMEDAPLFSLDVSVTKARTVVYFSGPDLAPEDRIPGVPLGTAITTRTLGFLTQPAYPPTIDGRPPGALESVARTNEDPARFDRMGNAPPAPGLQSGLIFFPGAAPLYDGAGRLIGGVGVSGDGVEEDDFVTAGAVPGFEPPPEIRADQFRVDGARLPYFKFPQVPGPGR